MDSLWKILFTVLVNIIKGDLIECARYSRYYSRYYYYYSYYSYSYYYYNSYYRYRSTGSPGIIAGAVVGSIIGAAIIIIVIVICCKMKNAKPRKPFVIKPTQPKRNVAVYTSTTNAIHQNGTAQVYPPPQPFQYTPNLPPPSYASQNPAYPPPAYNYGYK